MKHLILAAALACGGCTAAVAVERVRTAASYAVTISDAVCPTATVPEVIKACAALAPIVPIIRDLLPDKVPDPA